MVMNMHKYDHTKGSKAFSYFSVVAKNYLILHNNNNYKKLKTHDDFESDGMKQKLYYKFDNKPKIVCQESSVNWSREGRWILLHRAPSLEKM